MPAIDEGKKQRLMEEAFNRALTNRQSGYHCSESVFLAVNQTLHLMDPAMVRMVTGFHGGGGAHRHSPEIDLNYELEVAASGLDKRPLDEKGVSLSGHFCGALASGIICFGYLYGRRKPGDDLTCVDELCFEYHRRFKERFGYKTCDEIRQYYAPQTEEKTCLSLYRQASAMIVELILDSGLLVDRCPGYELHK